MQASIHLGADPAVRYVLRLGDTCLVLAQRLSEWCGHAPVLEEDIALANMALDLLGQARALLSLAALRDGRGLDEDQLAFLRDERTYLNATIAELPRGDFAFTVVRNAMLSALLMLLWQQLADSSDPELAAIAAKASKEARYHHRHAADWVVRLGDGTAESKRRAQAAVDRLWRYMPEVFAADHIDRTAAASGLGPDWSELESSWRAQMDTLLEAATLEAPAPSAFRSHGKQGVHSEHLGYLLAEMQTLQRSFPGATW